MITRVGARQRGSFAVEFLIIAPVLMLVSLLAVHHGRVAALRTATAHAADSAARAASLVSPAREAVAAQLAVTLDLDGSGTRCLRQGVTLSHVNQPGGRLVKARVTCTSSVDGLRILGARTVTVTAESAEQIDVYTAGR